MVGDVAALDLNARFEISGGFVEFNRKAAISPEYRGRVVGQEVCCEVVCFVVFTSKRQTDGTFGKLAPAFSVFSLAHEFAFLDGTPNPIVGIAGWRPRPIKLVEHFLECFFVAVRVLPFVFVISDIVGAGEGQQ